MQPASAPYLLRALYKDEYLADQSVARPATELMTHLFGAQLTNRYDAHVTPVSKGLYSFFTLLKGQTLGGEFCDLLPVTGGPRWCTVGATRKLLLGLLQMLEPSAVFYAARRFLPDIPPHDVQANVNKVVMCLLFLFERYGTLPHRLLQIRHLSLLPARRVQGSDGARGSYLILGLVQLVELVVLFLRYQRYRRQQQRQRQHGGTARTGHATTNRTLRASGNGDDDDDEDDEEGDGRAAENGKCMLCLSNRRMPTATQCGHIFCWSCIAEWIRSNPREAVCPFCRQHITAQSLVPLFFYVAKEPQRVGHAAETSAAAQSE